MTHPSPRRDAEGGFATLALVTLLIPLMFMVGSFLQTMSGRQNRLELEIGEEQALLAAEAGVDVALHEARRGTLVAGFLAEYGFQTELSRKSRADIICTYLGDDDVDNDGDGYVDEADEDVFRVTSTGYRGTNVRRVAAYLGFTSFLPSVNGAVTLTDPATTVDIRGTPAADGRNRDLRGGLTGSDDVYGIAMTPPGTVADLQREVTDGEMNHVLGIGGTPSLGTGPYIDIPTLVGFARNAASEVLIRGRVSDPLGTLREPVIAFRQGNLSMNGNHSHYGLLVVDGDLTFTGNATFHGVIVCTGNVDLGAGNFQMRGAMILGPDATSLSMRGTTDLQFSADGVALAGSLLGRYSSFNGWQEISTN